MITSPTVTRKLSVSLCVFSCAKTSTVFFINQLRENWGYVWKSRNNRNALKFYASVRLDIRRSTQIKDGDNVLGNRTKVKVVKTK
jgi:recombination protein RecA